MLGAAYSRVISAVNRRLVAETLALWVVAPVVAVALSYVLGRFV
jgi:phosphate/sulfate permease